MAFIATPTLACEPVVPFMQVMVPALALSGSIFVLVAAVVLKSVLFVASNYDYRPCTQECFTVSSFPSSGFLACEGWIYELRPMNIGVASVERYRTRSERSGKRELSKVRRRDAQPT